MDRSFAGRLGIATLTRPTSRSARRPPRRSKGTRSRSANATLLDRAIEQLWRAVSAAGQQLTRGTSFVWSRRRLRFEANSLALSLPLPAGGWLLLPNSSFLLVEHVRVSGLHG